MFVARSSRKYFHSLIWITSALFSTGLNGCLTPNLASWLTDTNLWLLKECSWWLAYSIKPWSSIYMFQMILTIFKISIRLHSKQSKRPLMKANTKCKEKLKLKLEWMKSSKQSTRMRKQLFKHTRMFRLMLWNT